MHGCLLWWYRVLSVVTSVYAVSSLNTEEFKESYWKEQATKTLQETLQLKQNTNLAKNIILFIGDGMGIPTITAANIYNGQKKGKSGEEQNLVFQKFPNVALIKTYSVDKQVPDSAATATAFLTGVKTKSKMLGVTAEANVSDCDSSVKKEIFSIMKWAQDEGKDTGFVTTTRVTHATPAALYAHTPQRKWEGDSELPKNASKCKDIARQLVEDVPGREAKVIFGGGRKFFMTENMTDVEYKKQKGKRKDGRDLVKLWRKDKEDRKLTCKYVTNREELDRIDPNEAEYFMGLFEYSHMRSEVDRNLNVEPSLAMMTAKAISILRKNEKGYFLLVEGGRIDRGHHDTVAAKALEDTVAMAEAVESAIQQTNSEDTLIIVTADHSHVMTINGYPERGNNILGIAGTSDVDNMSYTTLLYTTGPGQGVINISRADAKDQSTTNLNYTQQTLVPRKSETHGGEEVALFATGPMAHLFHGVKEQNYIAYAMAYASCVGPYSGNCFNAAGLATTIHFNYLISVCVIFLWLAVS